jgi:hypothetical protein
MLPATSLYIGLCGLVLIALSIRVIKLRWRHRVGLGDGGHEDLARAVRVHANFIEFAPLALLSIAGVEVAGFPVWLVHTLGAVFVAGRLLHAQGLMQSVGTSFGRGAGMLLTFGVLLAASALCIAAAFGLRPG